MRSLTCAPIFLVIMFMIGCNASSRPLSNEEALILAATSPNDSMFFWTRFDGVLVVDVDGIDIVPNQNPETIEAWLQAIDSLEDRGYISNEGLKVGVYVLTKEGHSAATKLHAAATPGQAVEHPVDVHRASPDVDGK